MRVELGPALRPLHPPQRRRPRSGCSRPRARPAASFVYASSSAASTATRSTLPTHEDETPRPLSPYGVTKLAAEHLCVLYGEEHGVDTVALRYFTVYGPRQRPDMAFRRFCEAIVAGAADRGLRRRPPDARLHLRRRHRRRHPRGGGGRARAPGRVYNIGGGDRDRACTARWRCWPGSPGARSTCASERESGDVRDTGADTGATARAELASRRDRPGPRVHSLSAS